MYIKLIESIISILIIWFISTRIYESKKNHSIDFDYDSNLNNRKFKKQHKKMRKRLIKANKKRHKKYKNSWKYE